MISRRQFLKIGSALVAGAAGSRYLGPAARGLGATDLTPPETLKTVPTFCELCFWKCGMIAHVSKQNVVYKIEGNPDHPLSNGKLCPRGVSAPGIVNDPDRLKNPLIRRKDSEGNQYFEEVSWEEALDYTAEKLQGIMDQYGPDKIALFTHGTGGAFFDRLLEAMGGETITHPSYAQCRGPRDTGYQLTFGGGAGNPEVLDVPHTRVLALIGSHLGENMHNTAVQDLSAAIDRGAHLITVDPRFSTVAGKSDYWLPVKPGTDIALLLAWAHVLIEENLYNKEFIDKHAMGFDELKEHVKDKTPEWAYIMTGVEAEQIRSTARLLGRYAPYSMVHPGRHVVWYGDDTQRSRAIAIVNALLGNWHQEGGLYLPTIFPIHKPHFPHEGKPKKFDFPASMTFPLASSIPSQVVVSASDPEVEGITEENRIRSWIAYGCNIPLTMPDPDQVLKSLEKLDFVLAVDILPMEITGYADVVLPESTFLERYDMLDARPFRKAFVALRQPAVKPMYNTKPGYWIARELSKRIKRNGNTLATTFPWPTVEELVKEQAEESGIDFETLESKGVITGNDSPMYIPMDQKKFNTPTGKVELFSRTLQSIGQAPIPEFVAHEEPPPGYFRLLFGRTPLHTFSRTTNNALSLDIFPENEVWLHTEMAKAMNLRNGVYVRLKNQDGKTSEKVKLKVTERIRQDCIYMVHGFGHRDKRLTKGYGRGASDSLLISRFKTDPIMGGTGMNVNFVSIERAL